MSQKVLPGQRVDAPVKGVKVFGALTSAWSFVATADFDQVSAKGQPAGFVLDYSVVVEGDGAVYIAEGDVRGLVDDEDNPLVTGMKVTAASPLNCTAHGAGLEGISIRSVPDSTVARIVIGASSFT